MAKEEEEKAKADQEANKILWYNRFNVPARPTQSIDAFMSLLASESNLNRVFDYMDCPNTVSAYEDYKGGLDAIASDEDRKMLDYYKESLKHKSHH